MRARVAEGYRQWPLHNGLFAGALIRAAGCQGKRKRETQQDESTSAQRILLGNQSLVSAKYDYAIKIRERDVPRSTGALAMPIPPPNRTEAYLGWNPSCAAQAGNRG
jgi:hypothetical protein